MYTVQLHKKAMSINTMIVYLLQFINVFNTLLDENYFLKGGDKTMIE